MRARTESTGREGRKLGTSGNSSGQIKQNKSEEREGEETRALLQHGLAVSVSAAAAAER